MKHLHSFVLPLALLFLHSQLLVFYPSCCASSHTQKQDSQAGIESQALMPQAVGKVHDPAEPGGLGINYLAAVQDLFHQGLNVYTDYDAAGNHFLNQKSRHWYTR
jgi:hypothetical protein